MRLKGGALHPLLDCPAPLALGQAQEAQLRVQGVHPRRGWQHSAVRRRVGRLPGGHESEAGVVVLGPEQLLHLRLQRHRQHHAQGATRAHSDDTAGAVVGAGSLLLGRTLRPGYQQAGRAEAAAGGWPARRERHAELLHPGAAGAVPHVQSAPVVGKRQDIWGRVCQAHRRRAKR